MELRTFGVGDVLRPWFLSQRDASDATSEVETEFETMIKAAEFSVGDLFHFSASDNFVAVLKSTIAVAVYELPEMTMLKDSNNDRIPLMAPNVRCMSFAPFGDNLLAYFSLNKGANESSELVLIRLPEREFVTRIVHQKVFAVSLAWNTVGSCLAVSLSKGKASKPSCSVEVLSNSKADNWARQKIDVEGTLEAMEFDHAYGSPRMVIVRK